MNRFSPLLALLVVVVLLAACGQSSDEATLIPPEVAEQPADAAAEGAEEREEVTRGLAVQGIGQSSEADQVLALINTERAANGCPPLMRNDLLTVVAYGHSEDMALQDYVAHDGSDGSKFSDRIVAAGYIFSQAAENIAAGTNNPEQLLQLWMESEGHRANILNCALSETGVGYYRLENDTGNVNYTHYWTQVFAAP